MTHDQSYEQYKALENKVREAIKEGLHRTNLESLSPSDELRTVFILDDVMGALDISESQTL